MLGEDLGDGLGGGSCLGLLGATHLGPLVHTVPADHLRIDEDEHGRLRPGQGRTIAVGDGAPVGQQVVGVAHAVGSTLSHLGRLDRLQVHRTSDEDRKAQQEDGQGDDQTTSLAAWSALVEEPMDDSQLGGGVTRRGTRIPST